MSPAALFVIGAVLAVVAFGVLGLMVSGQLYVPDPDDSDEVVS